MSILARPLLCLALLAAGVGLRDQPGAGDRDGPADGAAVREGVRRVYDDPQVQQYVNNVGMSLVQFAGRQELPWQFRVVDLDRRP